MAFHPPAFAPLWWLSSFNGQALSAEARLPATLPNSQEASGPFDEFEDRVQVFSEFASDEQRAEIASIVERFLARYDNARFKAYYAPRLRKLLHGGSPRFHGLDVSKEPTSSTPWSIIVVLIVAAGGLLWLLLKRRF
ncbi:MAG: hypothetical protein ACKVY0_04010 [Prosthecobacter sp.]|uniref:hypothetical protein n=1 Tax=Prosthecobacter sp. TaxID=1965333 RepID=UPI003902B7F0